MSKVRAPVIAMTETAAWRRRNPGTVPLAQLAAIEFEPVPAVAVITAENFAQAVQQHAAAAAEAAALVSMSKAELVALVRRANVRGDSKDHMLALMMEEARVALQAALDLMTSASARLKVAQAVVTVGGR